MTELCQGFENLFPYLTFKWLMSGAPGCLSQWGMRLLVWRLCIQAPCWAQISLKNKIFTWLISNTLFLRWEVTLPSPGDYRAYEKFKVVAQHMAGAPYTWGWESSLTPFSLYLGAQAGRCWPTPAESDTVKCLGWKSPETQSSPAVHYWHPWVELRGF